MTAEDYCRGGIDLSALAFNEPCPSCGAAPGEDCRTRIPVYRPSLSPDRAVPDPGRAGRALGPIPVYRPSAAALAITLLFWGAALAAFLAAMLAVRP